MKCIQDKEWSEGRRLHFIRILEKLRQMNESLTGRTKIQMKSINRQEVKGPLVIQIDRLLRKLKQLSNRVNQQRIDGEKRSMNRIQQDSKDHCPLSSNEPIELIR